jgi:hypothetical protein
MLIPIEQEAGWDPELVGMFVFGWRGEKSLALRRTGDFST